MREERKRDYNTEGTEGRAQRAERREEELNAETQSSQREAKPKTQVKNRTWGTHKQRRGD